MSSELNESIQKKTTFLAPLFTFVKEDKDGDEKPKETKVIEFLSKLRADSNTTG